MKKPMLRKKSTIPVFVTSFCFLFSPFSHAADVISPASFLPSTVEPGQIGKTLTNQTAIQAPLHTSAPLTPPKEEEPGALGPQAAKIKFHLNKIVLEGEHVYTEKQLLPLYKDQLNKTISVQDLENIVQSITNYYRNNGYILSRAILPPQHVANGIVHVKVIEGYISSVKVQGDPKRAKCILHAYMNNVTRSRPLQIKVLEHYLRVSNEIPGMNVRGVLEPSKTDVGASDIDLIAQEKTINGYLSYDDYGTRYIGPQQITAYIAANSIFQSGDMTHITTVRTGRPQELQYVDFSHDFPIGDKGFRASIGANDSRTHPGFVLKPTKTSGDSTTFYAQGTYPILRARDQDLTLDGGFNYVDSQVNIGPTNLTLYYDHIRNAHFGFNYDSSDSFKGSNLLGAHIEQGLPLFGASQNPNSLTVSRFGADGIYTKVMANAGRLQQLFWRFSTFIYATGQYSFNPLLVTPQFAYGGSQLGRGYDPAEIIGDRGAAGSIELRMDTAPGWFFLQTLQPYVFYDAGAIWNIKNLPGTKQKQSATSVGFGFRFVISSHFNGNLMLAQPLTKQVSAEELIGNGRKPRGFFSITASL